MKASVACDILDIYAVQLGKWLPRYEPGDLKIEAGRSFKSTVTACMAKSCQPRRSQYYVHLSNNLKSSTNTR